MAWANVDKAPIQKSTKRGTPDGLWMKCRNCHEVIYTKDFAAYQNVCPRCKHHYPIKALHRIEKFVDADSFFEHDAELSSVDMLGFSDRQKYVDRIKKSKSKTGRNDAILTGSAKIQGLNIQLGVFDFEFMGGSMGSVVGEKIARMFLRGAEKKEPVIIFSASGGARMQEGILSLMQMAKTCAALSRMRDAGVPLISVLTNPTTGGVAASYAMLGDINIAEPGALIGFAGPRVIRQTIGEELPEGFQSSEYLLEHGMVDFICHRDALRDRIGSLVNIILNKTESV